MKYQIGEVVRFSDGVSFERLGGRLATITDAKQYGNYGDGTLAPGPVYKTAITGDKWIHQDYLVPVNGGMPKHRCNFLSDEEKMYDFLRLSKEEFLASYSYLTEEEYDATTEAYRTLSKVLQDWVDECKRIAWQSCQGADQLASDIGGEIDHKESVSESVALSIKSLCDAVKTLNDDDLELLCLEAAREQEHRDSRQQRQLAGAIASAMDAYLREVGSNRDFYFRGGEYISMQDMYDVIVNGFDLNAS